MKGSLIGPRGDVGGAPCRSFSLAVLLFTGALASLSLSLLFAHQAEKDGSLRWRLESSHSSLGLDDEDLYVRASIEAMNVRSEGRRPLALAVVFDRSGSMAEDAKIGYVRQAAHLLVDNLTPEDQAAFIAYNQEVQTLVPLHQAVNREYLHHRIEELHADGYTNLSAGLLEGCAQLERRAGEGRRHVILLTDGLANRGVTDPKKLAALAGGCAERGITITTMGVGTDYDEKLLGGMAQAGGGRYVYVAKPEQIPAAFERELGALLAVLAQNVRLKLEVPPGADVEQVFGVEEAARSSALDLSLGDLSSGEERVVLVKFRVIRGTRTAAPLQLRATLTYDDVSRARRVDAEQTLAVAPAEARVVGGAGPVSAYARLVEALDKIALAVNGMDRRLADEVLQIRKQDYPALKKTALEDSGQDFVNKAFLFEHFARELEELIAEGALHEHSEARAELKKELHYRRYMRDHHRPPH